MKILKHNVLCASMVLCAALFFSLPGGAQDTIQLKTGLEIYGKIDKITKKHKVIIYPSPAKIKKILVSDIDTILSNKKWLSAFPKNKSGEIVYSNIVRVQGYSKGKIYNSAITWMAGLKNEDGAVVEVDDREVGLLIANVSTDITYFQLGKLNGHKLRFSIRIQAKENRFKYSIINPSLQSYPSVHNYYPTIVPVHLLYPSQYCKMNKLDRYIKKMAMVWMEMYCYRIENEIMSSMGEEDDW